MNELMFYDLKRNAAMVPSLSSQVARELGYRIVSSIYPPGALIDDEAELCKRFHVSRSVVRDAVKVLAGKGLLEVRRGIGTRVRPRRDWGILDGDVLAWHLSAPPNRDFLNDLMDTRQIFEPKAAAWAAQRATASERAKIATACRRMEEEKGSVEDFVVADAHFHRDILLASHNEFLSALEGVVYSALLVSIRLTNKDPRDNEDSLGFHRAVSDAIACCDAAKAEQSMQILLADARRRLESSTLTPRSKKRKEKRS